MNYYYYNNMTMPSRMMYGSVANTGYYPNVVPYVPQNTIMPQMQSQYSPQNPVNSQTILQYNNQQNTLGANDMNNPVVFRNPSTNRTPAEDNELRPPEENNQRQILNPLLPHNLNSFGNNNQIAKKDSLLDKIFEKLRYLDRNGITENDFVETAKKVFGFSSTEKFARKIFTQFDRDKDGKISLNLAFDGAKQLYTQMENLANKFGSFVKKQF